MRIPEFIKISGSKWRVKLDVNINKALGVVGLCVYGRNEIILSTEQSRNELEETFLHEILHACWPDDLCNADLEEKIISKLSPALYKTLRDNKLFSD